MILLPQPLTEMKSNKSLEASFSWVSKLVKPNRHTTYCLIIFSALDVLPLISFTK